MAESFDVVLARGILDRRLVRQLRVVMWVWLGVFLTCAIVFETFVPRLPERPLFLITGGGKVFLHILQPIATHQVEVLAWLLVVAFAASVAGFQFADRGLVDPERRRSGSGWSLLLLLAVGLAIPWSLPGVVPGILLQAGVPTDDWAAIRRLITDPVNTATLGLGISVLLSIGVPCLFAIRRRRRRIHESIAAMRAKEHSRPVEPAESD